MDWKFEKNMYPILDTRVYCKLFNNTVINGDSAGINSSKVYCK